MSLQPYSSTATIKRSTALQLYGHNQTIYSSTALQLYGFTAPKGQLALLSLLIIGAITLAAALSASFISRTEIGKGFRASQASTAQAVAESCMEEALGKFKDDPDFQETTINFENEAKCLVSVFYEDTNKAVFYVTAQIKDVFKKLEAHITRSGENLQLTNIKELPTSAWNQTKWESESAAAASHHSGNQNDWTDFILNANTTLANNGNDLKAGMVQDEIFQTSDDGSADTPNVGGFKP